MQQSLGTIFAWVILFSLELAWHLQYAIDVPRAVPKKYCHRLKKLPRHLPFSPFIFSQTYERMDARKTKNTFSVALFSPATFQCRLLPIFIIRETQIIVQSILTFLIILTLFALAARKNRSVHFVWIGKLLFHTFALDVVRMPARAELRKHVWSFFVCHFPLPNWHLPKHSP